MKKLILLLFIPLVSFGQEITISSTESEILIYSEETLNLLESNYNDMGVYGYVSQTKWVDFDNDGHKDIITSVAGDPYRPAILCIFLWDESSQKFIEDNQYLMIVQGEKSFWSETVGDFNGDGLNDVYVPVSNYHGEEGQQPDYYPENTNNMPGHLFLNNGFGFDSQFIDPTIMDWGYPNYERGFVLDVDNDDILDIIVPSVNQHPENNMSEPFLASKYNVSAQNEITRDFIYPWEDTYNTSSGFFMQAHSIMFNEYNNNIYVLYQGNEEWTDNGPYSYPEVSIYSKEIDSNGNFILLDKFRLERGNNDINHDSYVNRTSFYIDDLDGDGNEEFFIQMFTENAVPHAGLHVFDHTGQEITQDWFIEDSSLGHSANGFFFKDLNNDGNVDLLMSDIYTEDQNEIVIYLNNGGQFVKKIVELDDGGFYYPIDVNNDGFFELLQLVANSGTLADNYQAEIHYLNYSDDNDNDGVMDDVDQCPFTNTGETVNENGCSDNELNINNSSGLVVANDQIGMEFLTNMHSFEIQDGDCPSTEDDIANGICFNCSIRYKMWEDNYVIFDYNSDGKKDLFAFLFNAGQNGVQGNHESPQGKLVFYDDYLSDTPEPQYFDSEVLWGGWLDINDFNNDGFYDILVTGNNAHETNQITGIQYEDIPFEIFFFNADGFSERRVIDMLPFTSNGPMSGDIDNDGDVDIMIQKRGGGDTDEWRDSRSFTLLNDGQGNFVENFEFFTEVPAEQERMRKDDHGQILYDINEDGCLDWILPVMNNGQFVIDNNILVEQEIDGGGPLSYDDLIYVDGEYVKSGSRIFWGNCSGNFSVSNSKYFDQHQDYLLSELSEYNFESLFGALNYNVFDFNQDGINDIILAKNYHNHATGLQLFMGNEDGTYTDATQDSFDVFFFKNTGEGGNQGQGDFTRIWNIAVKDKDGDGDMDLIPWGMDEFQNECWEDYLTGQEYWEFREDNKFYFMSDVDMDGIYDSDDNCPSIANPSQEDLNQNETGDICEEDSTPPSVYCADISVNLNGGEVTIVASQIDDNSTDEFGIESFSIDIDTFDCSNLGENAVILTVTDVNGYSSECTAIVTVNEAINPTITAPDSVSVSTNEACTATDVSLGSLVTSNICSVASTTNDAPDIFDLGETIVTWTVTDGSGNTTSTTQTVTVTDNTNPTVLCNDITLILEEGIAVISAEDINNGSFDDCGEVTLSINQTEFDESHIGNNTIILNVTDSAGNTNTCEATVNVEAGLSIEENMFNSIAIYPNPTSEYIYIRSNNSFDYELFNMLGQRIKSGNLLEGNNEINLKNYSDGVYFINFLMENKKYTKKIVIKK